MPTDDKIRFTSFSESIEVSREEDSEICQNSENVYQELSNFSTMPSDLHCFQMSANFKTVTCNFTRFTIIFTLLIILMSLFVTLFISYIVQCDESKVVNFYEQKKASMTINEIYSEFMDTWKRQEFERETVYKSEKLEWISEKNLDKKRLDKLVPGGLERFDEVNLLMYVGRATHLNGSVVGKYCPYLDTFYYGYSGVEYYTAVNYEVLRYPEGAVSWLPANGKNFSVPLGSLVFGSKSPFDGENTYICRMNLDDHLVIGKYLPSSSGCLAAYIEKEHHHKDDFEVLVINRMGEAMGVGV